MTDYSRGDYADLPAGTTDLENNYTAPDLTAIASNDNSTYAEQTANNEIAIHQYKKTVAGQYTNITWSGKSSLAPSESPVIMEVYNVNGTVWEELDRDDSTAADTDFDITYNNLATADYLDSGVITWRVYQDASAPPAGGTVSDSIQVFVDMSRYKNRPLLVTANGVFTWIQNSSKLKMLKLVAGSFEEQDADNAPACTSGYDHASGAINSSDYIGICYCSDNTHVSFSEFRTDTNLWVSTDAVATIASASATSTMGVAYDSSNKPHVAFIDNTIGDYPTTLYSYKVTGSFITPFEIRGTNASKETRFADIIIDGNGYPCISFITYTDQTVSMAMADTNTPADVSDFTITDIDSVGTTMYYGRPSPAIDSNGDIWVAYTWEHGHNGRLLTIISHDSAAAPGTWLTPDTIDSSNLWREPSLAISGTSRYIFLEKVTAADGGTTGELGCWYNTGTGWTYQTMKTGTYSYIKVRWAGLNNPAYGAFDFIYVDDSNYTQYATLTF